MPSVAVRGVGLRLSGATGLDDLARQLGAEPPPVTMRRFAAPDSALVPVERPVHGPVEPDMPDSVGKRGLRSLPYESLLALAAAADTPVLPSVDGPAADRTAVVWASSTAGLHEYATVCTEASTLEPGLVSPALGPASAYNGPASTVSIRLGLTGPNLSLTGGATAGMSAIAEAMRLIAGGDASAALVGASSSLTRWSLTVAPYHLVPAEGAACLTLHPRADGQDGVTLGECRRTDLVRATVHIIQSAARPETRPDGLVVSALDSGVVDALSANQPFPVWHVEKAIGDFGAAGGFLAVVCAAALCARATEPTTILAVAVEPCGSTATMEVSSL
ncbi:beta-ketoacyl synthase N-terminal-like domain-containing protein [Phytohabitans rumicis]|uniref:Beta-ketoacyl synthase-like N-terminal domain-containing protein n=1 Tax=Phytohabitans rumicis TaxID=1076125 RepID=A0A6V8L4E5_9ACTN|nr:beta-ketoacyl synthase N-terminal-like domain-containing protein [Phytohabitans rumicis]GFJ92132.1 hypothetical protein Prum_057740 [Phytohabitans rumicis]